MARKLADSGAIQTVKIGSRHKVHLSEIERFRQYGNYDATINYDQLPTRYAPKDIPSREPNITLPKDESLYHTTTKTGQPDNTPQKTELDPVEKADKHLDYPAWIRRIPK